MLLSKLLNENCIILDLKSKEKIAVLKEIVDNLEKGKEIPDKKEFLKAMIEREKLKSTGIGRGIALPHAKTESLKKPIIAFARSKEGIDFKSLDGKPVHLIFALGSSEMQENFYLEALARLASMLRNKKIRQSLIGAKDTSEVLKVIKDVEGA
jgi:PTS system fructose-specific IIC component